MRRVKVTTILNWMKENKIVGVPLVFLISYLVVINAITILGHSGDQVCAGTLDDLCEARVTFQANEDIFVYPNESWGLSTDVPIKSINFFRTWGSGLRKIDLSTACNGAWCGCYWCDSNNKAKYSYVFREGKTYTVVWQVEKFNPYEDIKWSIDVFDIDPVWLGINIDVKDSVSYVYEKVCVKKPEYKEKIINYPYVKYPNGSIRLESNFSEFEFVKFNEVCSYNMKKRVGVKIDNLVTNGFFNVKDNIMSEWSVPIGDRNFDLFPDCRTYEIDKGVCKEIDIK